ncbi:hypothetical protein PHYPSEUDO_006229 [Phytophthora pseudosyringae]|uniref:Uncharacterized protein n=1 Tax=Phytophthora pseudosyringae TaxID=221518 RepID=A0A8T1VJD3_9STRA|nr:hypothetical protein PHYPSEUDO_006229 [Phytophthora pseudosyringae]
MSPETDANDHVPLEFLLGARAKYYYAETSTAKHQGRSTKAKHIFPPSIHPRRREEQARQLLQRVLEQDDSGRVDGPSEMEILPAEHDRAALLKALAGVTSTPLGDSETIFDDDNFQLSFEDVKRSPAQIKTLQQLRDDDLRRQNQRVTSFHGYEQGSRSFLDVTGAAARIPRTTIRQLRDLKLNVVKAKKKLEGKRTQELQIILQEQQEHTRISLHQHQQLVKALQQQKHPGVVSTSMLSLDSVDNSTNDWSEIAGRRSMPTLQIPDSYYEQQPPQELEHPRRPVLAMLNFDARGLSPSHKSVAGSDGDLNSISTNNEEDTQDNAEASDVSEQVSKRLGDRQREVFASSAANGLFLGGGFIAKKTKDHHERKAQPISRSINASNRLAQATSEREFLDTVLGAHSASILPLAEANKPALRRREASAGCRRPKLHRPPPNNE